MARLLGQESVSSEIAALFELVKNGYDADAELVTVTFKNFKDDKQNGKITIVDDGDGMTMTELKDKWMVVGTSSKERSPISRRKKRNVIGNKGIGRFATERLSKKTTLISKSHTSADEFELIIDWTDYEKENVTFDQVHNVLATRPTTKKSHTTIILENLRDEWTQEKIIQLKTDISLLVIPKALRRSTTDEFNVDVIAKDFDIKTLPTIQSSLFKIAPYKIESSLGANRTSFKFKIFCLGRLDFEETVDLSKTLMKNGEQWRPFGKCKVVLYYYPRSSKYEKWDDHYKKHGMKIQWFTNTLNEFHGVKIYRDGFWVRPYGGEGDDWLGLEKKRVQGNLRVGNSQVIGFIEIAKDANPGIIDTTTRERLVGNTDFFSMKTFIDEIFNHIYDYRHIQNKNYKDADIKIYHEESLESEINRADETIKKLDKIDQDTKKTLHDSMRSISKVFRDFKSETNESIKELEESERTYRNMAALGISVTAASHEIGHILPHLSVIPKNIDHKLKKFPSAYKTAESDLQRITNKINIIMHFTRFVISFAEDIAHDMEIKQRKETFDMGKEITETLSDLKGIFSHLNIDFILIMKQNPIKITMNKSDLQSILLNLISNSIKALKEMSKKAKKEIKITITQDHDHLKIQFSDNGDGISQINQNKIFRMFFTTYKRGTGLGLSIIQEILSGYSGKITLHTNSKIEKGATFDILIPIKEVQ